MSSKLRKFSAGSAATDSIGKVLVSKQSLEAVEGEIETSKIDLDPDNPRELHLDPLEPGRLDPDSPHYELQKQELESLQGLADSIVANGLLHAITVYRYGDRFRLIAGERRVLAHRLKELTAIRANIRPSHPTNKSMLQLIENMQREGLSLHERLRSVAQVKQELERQGEQGDADALQKAGLSQTTAYRYLQILEGPKALLEAIQQGVVNNLKTAAAMSSLPPSELEAALVVARQPPVDPVAGEPAQPKPPVAKPTPKAANGTVVLGRTSTSVLERLVEAVGGRKWTKAVNWADRKAAVAAFRKMIEAMEKGEL